jgi:hypothetical protein
VRASFIASPYSPECPLGFPLCPGCHMRLRMTGWSRSTPRACLPHGNTHRLSMCRGSPGAQRTLPEPASRPEGPADARMRVGSRRPPFSTATPSQTRGTQDGFPTSRRTARDGEGHSNTGLCARPAAAPESIHQPAFIFCATPMPRICCKLERRCR